MRVMADDLDARYWLDLSLAEGVGARIFQRLLRAFGTPRNALNASPAALRQYCSEKTAQAIRDNSRAKRVREILKWTDENQCHIITYADSAYPPALLEIPDPPPLLYARGNVALLQRTQIAIVGSRNASAVGMRNTKNLAQDLSDQNICVVSGLAQGIDTAAHEGALMGMASTIAVVGTGIDVVYPKVNRKLAAEIAQDGLIVTELELGMGALNSNFPRRNRIISGLADACLVAEAGLNSGSLITAQFALEQNREVFAVPGSINDPSHRGCHRLIRQGAKLVETVFDILEEMNIKIPTGVVARAAADGGGAVGNSAEDEALLQHIGYEPTSFDEIATRSGLTAQQLTTDLLNLEMTGKVVTSTGGRYQRV